MRLPSKTVCQLATLSRALTDPKADDFEALEAHEMRELVRDIAKSHVDLEDMERNQSFIIASINDSAFNALEAIKNGAPLEVIEQCVIDILDAMVE
ncbi:hypothetical protein ACX1NX_03035 [Acinetobacter sp. ANC 5383]